MKSSNRWFFSCVVLLLALILCSCVKKEQYTIGCISPFSGNGAVYGEALQRGFSIYLDELRKSDPTCHVKIIYEDDRLNAAEGVKAIQSLIQARGVKVIIGAFTSDVSLAIAPVAERERVVLVIPTATNYKLREAGDFVFRVCPSDSLQGETMASFVSDNLKIDSCSILYMNTDYGVGLATVFQSSFRQHRGIILSAESFEKDANDMRTQITKLKNYKPEAVFLPSNYSEAAHVVTQARELGLTTQFVCTDGVFQPEFLELAKDASEGVYISTMAWGSGESKPVAEKFKSTYREKYNTDPGAYSALCYDALAVVVDALRRSDKTSEGIKNALYQTRLLGVTGLNAFDHDGEVRKCFDVFKVKDNQFERVAECQ